MELKFTITKNKDYIDPFGLDKFIDLSSQVTTKDDRQGITGFESAVMDIIRKQTETVLACEDLSNLRKANSSEQQASDFEKQIKQLAEQGVLIFGTILLSLMRILCIIEANIFVFLAIFAMEDFMKKLPMILLILTALFAMSACDAEQAVALYDGYDYDYIADLPEAAPEPEPTPEPTPEPAPEPNPIHIRIQFAGDILLHGGLGAGTGQNTYNYRPFMWAIRPYINGDLAIVNMETPVDVFGNNQGIATWPRFNAPFEILDGLIYAGFNHLISANNHSFDKGFDGLVATLANFERAGITQTGMYTNEEDFNTPTIIDVEGIQVGIIAYTDSVNGLESLVPADIRPFTIRRFRSHVPYDVPYMAIDIANMREAGANLVIISLHWGAEYVDYPTNMQVQIARSLVDAGADIIMGHHSHTPQPLEWHYRKDGSRGLIIYSLGNFLADQIALGIPATQYGMLVTAYVAMNSQGEISVYNANVLPTLFARDSGRTLGSPYSILPVINGEVPDAVAGEYLRAWGRRAYAHVVRIVGEGFVFGE